jgi:type I restriction enzyme S subunit
MSQTVKPGYKQTEVGVIPEDWDVSPFGSLAAIDRGKFSARPRNDPRFYGGDIPFIQTGDVTRSGGKITKFNQTLNRQGLRVSRLFPKETLFFTIAANIGDVGIASFEAACPDSLV